MKTTVEILRGETRDCGDHRAPSDDHELGALVSALRAACSATERGTLGVEEEVVLLHPDTLAPHPIGPDVVRRAECPQIVGELPRAQVELMGTPHGDAAAAVIELAQMRRLLAAVTSGEARPAAMAVHPQVDGEVDLCSTGRYRAIEARHGRIGARQLVSALQIHVALGDPDLTLRAYAAARLHLPEITAFATAAPFQGGRDTGLATVRPLVAGQLPRQGIPPALPSWEDWAREMLWGQRSGAVADSSLWWWELRPHPRHGTLEIRVADVQPDLASAEAVIRFVHGLVLHLAGELDQGWTPPSVPRWRIEENRWAALRGGVDGELADLETGERSGTRERLDRLIDQIEATQGHDMDRCRTHLRAPAAERLRAVGPEAAPRWLAGQFLAGLDVGGTKRRAGLRASSAAAKA